MTNTNETVIDLGTYRSEGSKVFSGRGRGKVVRDAARLDDCDKSPGKIRVIIPPDTYSVNTSFFLGLFGKSIRHFGNRETFLQKYSFDCQPEIMQDIDTGIDDALKITSPLED
jgi:hypothetical protein